MTRGLLSASDVSENGTYLESHFFAAINNKKWIKAHSSLPGFSPCKCPDSHKNGCAASQAARSLMQVSPCSLYTSNHLGGGAETLPL